MLPLCQGGKEHSPLCQADRDRYFWLSRYKTERIERLSGRSFKILTRFHILRLPDLIKTIAFLEKVTYPPNIGS